MFFLLELGWAAFFSCFSFSTSFRLSSLRFSCSRLFSEDFFFERAFSSSEEYRFFEDLEDDLEADTADEEGVFFLKAGNFGMVPLNPNPNEEARIPVVSRLSLCLSKSVDMSSALGILGSLDTGVEDIGSSFKAVILSLLFKFGFVLLGTAGPFVDGTFEC